MPDGPGGDIYWFNSCDEPEDIYESCASQHGSCFVDLNQQPVCGCTNQWAGINCDTCPEHWDIASNCSVCEQGWTGDRCDTPDNPVECEVRTFAPGLDNNLTIILDYIQTTMLKPDSNARQNYDFGRPSGVVMAVVFDGQLHSAQARGKRSKGGEPMTIETLNRIGSTSKHVTAVAAMSMVDEGIIDMDSPITTWFEEFEEAWGRQDSVTMDLWNKITPEPQKHTGQTRHGKRSTMYTTLLPGTFT